MEFRGCPKAIPSRLGKRCAVVAAYEQTSGAARRRELPSRVRARSTCRYCCQPGKNLRRLLGGLRGRSLRALLPQQIFEISNSLRQAFA